MSSEREFHGKINTPEYRVWLNMRQSCAPGRARAARGYTPVQVCPEWDSFPQFLRDVGRRPGKAYILVRLNPDKGFCPGNVVWRKRKGAAVRLELRARVTRAGVTKSIAEWAQDLGISRGALRQRLYRGWPRGDLLAPPGFSKKVVDRS